MSSVQIDFKYVYKRKRCLENNISSLTESITYVPDLSKITSPALYKQQVEKFFTDCNDYKSAINMLESLYDANKFALLEYGVQHTTQYIIPTIIPSEIKNCISYIKESSIDDIDKDKLTETAKLYKSIDRILKNHKNLSKRFKLTEFGKIGSIEDRCIKICEMVDSYDLPNFIKFNICLEEISFLSYNEGLNISDEEISENVANYFLLRDSNTKDDINSYKVALKESGVIKNKNIKSLEFLTESKYIDGNNWYNRLNRWKLDSSKNLNSIVEIAIDNLDDINAFNNILHTIDEFAHINELDFNIKDIFDQVKEVNGSEARNILNLIKEFNIEKSEDVIFNLTSIWEEDLNNTIYDDGTKTPETFTSNEIDKFKLHNIATDAQEVGEFLDQLEKTSMKETPLKIQNRVSANFDETIDESNLINYVDESGYITKKIRHYDYIGSVEEAYKLLDSSTKCINNILYNKDTRAFYTLEENGFDIWLRTKYKVILSEAQEHIRKFSGFDEKYLCDIEYYTNILEQINNSPLSSIIEKLNNRDYAAEVSIEEATLVFEMLNPYLDYERTVAKEFINLCREEANPKFDRIKEALENIKPEEFNIYDDHITRLELCADLMDIPYIHEDVVDNLKNAAIDVKKGINKVANKVAEKTSDNKTSSTGELKDNKASSNSVQKASGSELKEKEDDSDNKKESSFIDDKKDINSINDIKLVWQGVKAKAKNASAKEQEISRDLDMEFNHLCKTIQSTYGRDYREEIITGEINRSLSKIIKIAISLAGLGVATAGLTGSVFIAPAIGAIMLFVKSKHTSLKEKKMILDEIDIELQVLEREISRAEQSGSTKKYRQLLTIQKNLQRRRQEIYYNLAKNGKRIPMQSTTGLRSRE